MTERRETVDPREVIAKALWEHDECLGWNMNVECHADFLAKADAVLAALGIEQVGWADGSEPGAPVLMSMHFEPKVSSLWQPVFRLAYSGRHSACDAGE